MDGNTPKTDVYPGCITMNEFSSSMRQSTTQRNSTWRQFQWVWLHFQRSRSVQLCAKYSQIRKCYIQPLPSVLKDKKYLEKFPLRCLLGRKLKFWSVAPNSCCLVLPHVMLFWTWSCALFPKTPAKCQMPICSRGQNKRIACTWPTPMEIFIKQCQLGCHSNRFSPPSFLSH